MQDEDFRQVAWKDGATGSSQAEQSEYFMDCTSPCYFLVMELELNVVKHRGAPVSKALILFKTQACIISDINKVIVKLFLLKINMECCRVTHSFKLLGKVPLQDGFLQQSTSFSRHFSAACHIKMQFTVFTVFLQKETCSSDSTKDSLFF